jgi:hypothetical protein
MLKHTANVEKRHLSQLSDDEVEKLYTDCGENSAKAAREVGCGPSTFKQRISLIRSESYQNAKSRKEACQFLMEELEARGIDPTSVNIKNATVKTQKKRYSYAQKGKDGLPEIIPMKSDLRLATIQFSPKFEEGPEWPLIKPADIGTIKYVPRPKATGTATRKVFFWPDTQIGFYRSVVTNELTPFHDLAAIDVALQMLHSFGADEVVVLGDFVDLPSMSRWEQLPEFQNVVQPSLQYAHILLARIRSIVGPDTPITYIAGNHEKRLSAYVAKNAIAAHGIRKVETDLSKLDPVTLVPLHWKWPQLSIVECLQLEYLGIKYSAEYPGGQHWLTPKLVAMHQPQRTVDLRATVVHGHIPKANVDTRTVHYYHGREEYSVIAVPGLMRVDDVSDQTLLQSSSVPSVGTRMNWQQGVATATIYTDDFFDVQVHRIKDGRGSMYGQPFQAL